MKIKREVLEALLGDLLSGFHVGQVMYRVHRYYCNRLTVWGKCPAKCHECKPELEQVFSAAQQAMSRGNVREPNGLLVWLLRNQVAQIAERNDKGVAKQATDWLGRPIERNPFALLKMEIGD